MLHPLICPADCSATQSMQKGRATIVLLAFNGNDRILGIPSTEPSLRSKTALAICSNLATRGRNEAVGNAKRLEYNY
jgi:hypothetical protein